MGQTLFTVTREKSQRHRGRRSVRGFAIIESLARQSPFIAMGPTHGALQIPVLGPDWVGGEVACKMMTRFSVGPGLLLGDSVYFPGLQPGGGDKSCRLCFLLWGGTAGSWQEVHRKASLPNYLSACDLIGHSTASGQGSRAPDPERASSVFPRSLGLDKDLLGFKLQLPRASVLQYIWLEVIIPGSQAACED